MVRPNSTPLICSSSTAKTSEPSRLRAARRTQAAPRIRTAPVAEAVVKAPPDGYTLLLVGGQNAINATLYEKLNFNFVRDIAPVASIASVPCVLLLNPLVPAKTVSEFIAYAKANPGKINMASAGVGTPVHMAGELF